MGLNRFAAALAAFIATDSLLTFIVSAAGLCIFKCDNSLGTAVVIAAGVFIIQGLAAVIMFSAAQDFSDTIDGEGR